MCQCTLAGTSVYDKWHLLSWYISGGGGYRKYFPHTAKTFWFTLFKGMMFVATDILKKNLENLMGLFHFLRMYHDIILKGWKKAGRALWRPGIRTLNITPCRKPCTSLTRTPKCRPNTTPRVCDPNNVPSPKHTSILLPQIEKLPPFTDRWFGVQ